MQPLNYATHAIENLAGILTLAPHKEFDRDMVAFTAEIIDLLARADKFMLPEWGRIFDAKDWEVASSVEVLPRLPFPIVLTEFHCDYRDHNTMKPGELPSSRRIALAIEYEVVREGMGQIRYPWLSAFWKHVLDDRKGFIILPVSYADPGKIWTPPPSGMLFARDEEGAVTNFAGTRPFVTPLGILSYDDYPEEERVERAIRDLSDETIAICHLLTAMSLDKPTSVLLPASEKLNKKRERAKRPPFFSYRVLDIVADLLASPREREGRPTGPHASPRMHKRRGHLRRLASGRVTWVRDTIVGKPSRGRVDKSYSVHR